MNIYQLMIPTKIYYGRDILREALGMQTETLKGNIMIVTTGRSLNRLGYVKALEDMARKLPGAGNVITFDRISANPRLSEAEEGILIGRKEKVNHIIGFGGGSAIDAAKAVAAGIGTGEPLEEFFYKGKEPSAETLPVIAIPTTAGTGSELSKAAILTDEQRSVKGGIRGTALYPHVAIVDSMLTEKVPLQVTMETGFDVVAHAVESYLSRAASPFTQMQSEYAIRLAGEYLPRLAENLDDIEARERMSFASMLMGINLGNASTCLPHRLQYPIGAHTDMSHGAGLAALYPAWIEATYACSAEKFNIAAGLLSGSKCCSMESTVNAFRTFFHVLHLKSSLKELGITGEMIPSLASEVSGSLSNDPAFEIDDIVGKIYRAAL